MAGLRRSLSMVADKAYSACLMDRVSRMGEGHRQAAKRRAWVKREGERMEDGRTGICAPIRQEKREICWIGGDRKKKLDR